jgi:hypothetical protein
MASLSFSSQINDKIINNDYPSKTPLILYFTTQDFATVYRLTPISSSPLWPVLRHELYSIIDWCWRKDGKIGNYRPSQTPDLIAQKSCLLFCLLLLGNPSSTIKNSPIKIYHLLQYRQEHLHIFVRFLWSFRNLILILLVYEPKPLS